MPQLGRKGTILCWILAVCFLLTVNTSCEDKDPYDPYANFDHEAQAKREDDMIQEYMKLHDIRDTVKTVSGLYYKKIKEGNGARPVSGDSLIAHYVGYYLYNSEIFQSTYSAYPHKPIKFKLGNGELIKGWDEGIPFMRRGEEAQLFIPSRLAYGLLGRPPIPGNTTLMFRIELIDVWR